jgi:hypothetical protein
LAWKTLIFVRQISDLSKVLAGASHISNPWQAFPYEVSPLYPSHGTCGWFLEPALTKDKSMNKTMANKMVNKPD